MSAARRFGLIVIGDEILSGRRRDGHFPRLAAMLDERGLELSWVRFIGDDPDLIRANLGETLAGGDVVFSCGGIGATPDDRTRECAAAALGLGLVPHPEGVRELEARFGAPVTPPERLRLVTFPEGCELVPNPVNRIPGFSIREHYFVPGFPSMAWPMMAWVLDTHYAGLQAPGRTLQAAMRVEGARESDVIPLMERFEAGHRDLRLSCLPDTHRQGYRLELGLRGERAAVEQGMAELAAAVEAMGFSWEPVALGDSAEDRA